MTYICAERIPKETLTMRFVRDLDLVFLCKIDQIKSTLLTAHNLIEIEQIKSFIPEKLRQRTRA